jgi:hypothetical protein
MQIFHENYFNTGKRNPFTVWGDLYLEYNLRIAKRYTVNLNATISNVWNTDTIQGYYQRLNYQMLRLTDEQLLGNVTAKKTAEQWINETVTVNPFDPRYGMWTSRFDPWSWRMGARFSF